MNLRDDVSPSCALVLGRSGVPRRLLSYRCAGGDVHLNWVERSVGEEEGRDWFTHTPRALPGRALTCLPACVLQTNAHQLPSYMKKNVLKIIIS